MSAETSAPRQTYWRIWTDEAGTSRQSRCLVEGFERQSMGGAAPQWNAPQGEGQAKVLFAVLPVDWVGEWHENPGPQWIIPLSGRWFVESMDGRRVEMGAGEVSFGGDQHCKADAHGHKGHRSGTVGNQPAVLMLVQVDEPTSRGRPHNALDDGDG